MHPNRAGVTPDTLAVAPIPVLALPALQVDTAVPLLFVGVLLAVLVVLLGSLRNETAEDGHPEVEFRPACGTHVEGDRQYCAECSRPASRRK